MSTNDYLVEFLGTFVFLFVILQSDQFQNLKPFVIASGLLVAILMFGSISGGHFNPAVTAMMYMKGDPSVSQTINVFGYMAAQILGGIAAWKAHSVLTSN